MCEVSIAEAKGSLRVKREKRGRRRRKEKQERKTQEEEGKVWRKREGGNEGQDRKVNPV